MSSGKKKIGIKDKKAAEDYYCSNTSFDGVTTEVPRNCNLSNSNTLCQSCEQTNLNLTEGHYSKNQPQIRDFN